MLKSRSQVRLSLRWMSATAALAAGLVLSSACASFDRSDASGYSDDGASDVGRAGPIDHGQPIEDMSPMNVHAAVAAAESSLEGRREREQYFKNRPYMKSDRERLEFLRLESFKARAHWLEAHGIEGAATPNSPEIQALVDMNDLTLGMTKQAVRDSWGAPELVEVAGNPLFGNERWHYNDQRSSTEGYQTEHRLVYFKEGRVVGWETK